MGLETAPWIIFSLLHLFLSSLFLLPYLTSETLFCIFCIEYNLATHQSILPPRILLENLPYCLLVRYCCIIFLMVMKKVLEKTGAYFYSRQLNQEPSSLEMAQLKDMIDVIIFRTTQRALILSLMFSVKRQSFLVFVACCSLSKPHVLR